MTSRKVHKEYIRRIDKATQYVLENIDGTLRLEDVAKASHFSAYHFHRVFHAILGETVNDYIVRKKMELAANRLVCREELSITDVSELGGYSSSANFSKAFKQYFGVSPSQLRKPTELKNSKIGKIFSKYGKEFNPLDLYSQTVTGLVIFDNEDLEELLMNVTVTEFGEKKLAFLTAPKGYDLPAIFDTWDKVDGWALSSGIDDYKSKRFAICHDNPMVTPTEHCRYDASIEIENDVIVNDPLSTQVMPAGKYAVAYYKGDSDKVSNIYMELYSNWLPSSGFEPDDYPPVAHYLNDSRVDGFAEMKILIKLKGLNER